MNIKTRQRNNMFFRFSFIFLLLAGFLFVVTSCEKKEDDKDDTTENDNGNGGNGDSTYVPIIERLFPLENEITVTPLKNFNVAIEANQHDSSNAVLTRFEVQRQLNGGAVETELDSTLTGDITEFQLDNLVLQASADNGTEVWTFIISDSDDQSSEVELSTNIVGEIPTGEPVVNLKSGTHAGTGLPYTNGDKEIGSNEMFVVGIAANPSTSTYFPLTGLKITRTLYTGSEVIVLDTSFYTTTFNQDFVLYSNTVEDPETWEFIVSDEGGSSGTASFVLNSGLNTFPDIFMTSYGRQDESNAFSATTGETFAFLDATASATIQGKVDIMYFDFLEWGNTFMSPNNDTLVGYGTSYIYELIYTWGTRNVTKFSKTTISSGDFNTVVNDIQLSDLILGDATIDFAENYVSQEKTDPIGMSPGQVLAFKTEAGLEGLLKITEINDDFASADSDITFDVKVLK